MDQSLAIRPSDQGDADKPPEMLAVLLQKRTQLLAGLQQHESELSALQNEYTARLTDIKEKQKSLQEALQHVEALLRLEGWDESAKQGRGTGEALTQGSISYIDAAHQLLEKTRQPMHYKTLTEKLAQTGVFIPGKDAAATLLTKIARDPRFKRIRKRGTYALSSWRIRAAKSRARRKKTR